MSVIKSIFSGLRLRCPFCYSGSLFYRYLKINKECPNCHASFEQADSGDGPAFFVMTLVGTIACIIMITIELKYSPSLWVHIIIQLIVILGLSFILLPIIKSLLVNLQYHFKATESHNKK